VILTARAIGPAIEQETVRATEWATPGIVAVTEETVSATGQLEEAIAAHKGVIGTM